MPQSHFQLRVRPLNSVLVCILGFVATCLAAGNANATVMRYADLERLVEISDVIVHATVEDRRTHIDDDHGLWTETTVTVHHTYWGESTQMLVFHQWGGRRGARIDTIAGDPQLEVDQEVVLFLRRDDGRNAAHSDLALAALSQAVFTVEEIDGHRMVRRKLADLSFLVAGSEGSGITEHSDPAHDWAAFKEILEGYINAAREEAR